MLDCISVFEGDMTVKKAGKARDDNADGEEYRKIWIKLTTATHRKLWERRLDTKKSMQEIASEILERELNRK